MKIIISGHVIDEAKAEQALDDGDYKTLIDVMNPRVVEVDDGK